MRKTPRWDGKLYKPVKSGDPVGPGGIPLSGTVAWKQMKDREQREQREQRRQARIHREWKEAMMPELPRSLSEVLWEAWDRMVLRWKMRTRPNNPVDGMRQ
jgi:hypothetical protein